MLLIKLGRYNWLENAKELIVYLTLRYSHPLVTYICKNYIILLFTYLALLET